MHLHQLALTPTDFETYARLTKLWEGEILSDVVRKNDLRTLDTRLSYESHAELLEAFADHKMARKISVRRAGTSESPKWIQLERREFGSSSFRHFGKIAMRNERSGYMELFFADDINKAPNGNILYSKLMFIEHHGSIISYRASVARPHSPQSHP